MRERMIQTALGRELPDLVLTNARIIDVFTGEILEGDVAICGGMIAGVGCYPEGRKTVDLKGKLLSPGLINAHCHVESSMASPAVYCREELRWGVTTVITDPHEIANVAGSEGIRYMLKSAAGMPVNYFIQLPSCVPSTPFEHAGSVLKADDLTALRDLPGVIGLGEMMNYPGVLSCDEEVLRKLAAFGGQPLDGHAPGLTGRELQAYLAAGISTDHECSSYEEAAERLRWGMAVLVREGSASRNLEELITGVVEHGLDPYNMAFCTDDKHLADLGRDGSVRWCVKKSIELGLKPAAAFRMASLNAARIYGLKKLGAVAPGYRADLVVFDGLEGLQVEAVYKDGVEVDLKAEPPVSVQPPPNSVHLAQLTPELFEGRLHLEDTVPVIGLIPGQIVTRRLDMAGREVESALAEGRLCRLAVIERHHATGNIGTGYLAGYGLKGGAIATTVAHDSHNLIVAGDNAGDMVLAARELARIGGGYAIVSAGRVTASLPLPIYGLMSSEPAEELIPQLERMTVLTRGMGVPAEIDPFVSLSFVALPVIPELRLTDMGMFDVTRFCFI